MDNEFSFYFNYQRITNCDPEYLKELYKDVENGEEIVEGILRDKERLETEQDNSQALTLQNPIITLYHAVIMGFIIMSATMPEVNERLARVEQSQLHQEKQLDRLVEVTEKLADVHTRMSNIERRVDLQDVKISQDEKQIAKWALICSIGFGLLATYFPELKAIIGL